jgi:hypothetical protein
MDFDTYRPGPDTAFVFSAGQLFQLLFVFFLANVFEYVFRTTEALCSVCAHGPSKMRNAVVYALELVITTPIFFVLVIASVMQWMSDEDTQAAAIVVIHYCSTFMVSLYLFELAYKLDSAWPWIAHHLATILCIYMSFLTLQDRASALAVSRFGTFITLTAVTEQPTFAALLLYRMERMSARLMWIAVWFQVFSKMVLVGTAASLFFVVEMWLYAPLNYAALVIFPGLIVAQIMTIRSQFAMVESITSGAEARNKCECDSDCECESSSTTTCSSQEEGLDHSDIKLTTAKLDSVSTETATDSSDATADSDSDGS